MALRHSIARTLQQSSSSLRASIVSISTKQCTISRDFSAFKASTCRTNISDSAHLTTSSQLYLSNQKRSMFIQTASTPNPESIKFMPGRVVIDSGNGPSGDGTTNGFYATRADKDDIARSPLSKRLFEIDGIKSVYLGADFVTVTKYAEAKWESVRTLVYAAIMDHYQSGKPALSTTPEITDTTILEDDDEIVAMIKELLETRIRPAVQEDGGDIRYVGFNEDSGVVEVQLAGSCVGCPSSSVTLKNGVENMLMHYIPEVTGVISVEEDEEGDLGDVVVETSESSGDEKKQKTYEERLAAAGIPFSD